jgi:hypothetical protein
MLPLIAAGVLFFVLSPGVLVTIPSGSRSTTTPAAVHAVVFMVALYALMRFFPGVVEGFTPKIWMPCTPVGEKWVDPEDPNNCATCSADGKWVPGCA